MTLSQLEVADGMKDVKINDKPISVIQKGAVRDIVRCRWICGIETSALENKELGTEVAEFNRFGLTSKANSKAKRRQLHRSSKSLVCWLPPSLLDRRSCSNMQSRKDRRSRSRSRSCLRLNCPRRWTGSAWCKASTPIQTRSAQVTSLRASMCSSNEIWLHYVDFGVCLGLQALLHGPVICSKNWCFLLFFAAVPARMCLAASRSCFVLFLCRSRFFWCSGGSVLLCFSKATDPMGLTAAPS